MNEFFQKLFSDADDDTKRAMMKSYSESGGTTLSTNWDEVSVGDGSLDVEPVLDLVQLVVLAVKRRRHLADVKSVMSATLQTLRS